MGTKDVMMAELVSEVRDLSRRIGPAMKPEWIKRELERIVGETKYQVEAPDAEDADHWLISHGADTTETGMTMNRTYLRTIWKGHAAQKHSVETILRDWCRERFGKETEYVQGVAPCANWVIGESSRESFAAAEPRKWGGYPTSTHRVVLLIGLKTTLGGELPCRVITDEEVS